MSPERINSETYYVEVLRGLTSKGGEATCEVIQEFSKGVEEERIKISFSDTIPVWRVARRRGGTAHLFLPASYSPDQVELEAIGVLVDTLSITRKLPGPRLKEMDQLRDRLKKELLATTS